MLSVATAASAIRDSFSRNNSDSEQSKDDTTDSPQKQSDKTDSLGNARLSKKKGFLTPPISASSTPKEENKQLKTDVDVESSKNLAETEDNVDTSQVVLRPSSSPSNSVSSLKIEHFDDFGDDLTTPIAGDITSQIPTTSSATLNDRSDSLSNSNNDSNTSRKQFRLPAKSNSVKPSKQKKRNQSIMDEGSIIDSPPLCNNAPAAPRRNAEFHALFRSVPEDDYLINDYGCALQKEILVQGRLYVSANHVCFNANIFGWVTNLVIAFSDIVSFEKRMTAFVIPNAILISTLHAKHFFTTFLSRDGVYELLDALWKQTHPSFTMTSLTESECGTSHKGSDASSEENSLSSDDEGKSTASQTGPRKKFALPKLTLDPMRLMRANANSISSSDDDSTLHQEKVDEQLLTLSPKKRDFNNSNVIKEKKIYRPRSKSDSRSEKFHSLSPRNQSRHIISKKRRPTQCDCLKKGQHYENVSLDTKFTGSVEKIFNLLFTSEFMKRYLTEEEKCTDVEIGEWNTEDSKWTRSNSYIKPLNNSIGPKSTKCQIKEECQHRDFDNYVTCLSMTTTPDVPSGGSFCVKNKICFMWAGANESRVIVTCTIEWSKSSWLKGTIERACIDGQQTHWKEYTQSIKKYIAAHPSEFRDESAPIQIEETANSEVVDEKAALKRTHTRIRPATIKTEVSPDLQENEPVETQHHRDTWSTVINMMSSILNSLIQSITAPSANTIILLILLMLVINNFNNWLTLRNIGYKLDSLNGNGRSESEFIYKSRGNREYTPLFDEHIENEGEALWQWLQDRSKTYDEFGRKEGTNSGPTPSKDHSTSPESEVSPSGDSSNSHHFGSRPISSQNLYEQIGDLYRLIQAAEGHVKKLVDVAEFESSYYKESEDNMSRQ